MYLGDSLIRLGRLDEARIPLLRAATVDPEGYFGNLAATMIHQMEAR
jgi:Flp pilus assembly protein TadD